MSTDSTPTVSVVVRCYNEGDAVGPVLEVLFGQQGPSFEVVALDSGSEDGTLELLARYPVRIEHLATKAFSISSNRSPAPDLPFRKAWRRLRWQGTSRSRTKARTDGQGWIGSDQLRSPGQRQH